MSTDYYLVCPQSKTTFNCGSSRGLYEYPDTLYGGVFEYLQEHEGEPIYFCTTDTMYDEHITPTLTSYSAKDSGWTSISEKKYQEEYKQLCALWEKK